MKDCSPDVAHIAPNENKFCLKFLDAFEEDSDIYKQLLFSNQDPNLGLEHQLALGELESIHDSSKSDN